MAKNLPTLEEIGSEADFMWVQVSYDRKLIFPVEQGLKYIGAMRGCLLLKEPYQKEKQIIRLEDEIKLGYMSKEEIQEIILAQVLLGTGDNDER